MTSEQVVAQASQHSRPNWIEAPSHSLDAFDALACSVASCNAATVRALCCRPFELGPSVCRTVRRPGHPRCLSRRKRKRRARAAAPVRSRPGVCQSSPAQWHRIARPLPSLSRARTLAAVCRCATRDATHRSGAGIQADLKTFAALGVYGCSVVTALTAQNTLGVDAVEAVSPGFVGQQLRTTISDIRPDAVKTGAPRWRTRRLIAQACCIAPRSSNRSSRRSTSFIRAVNCRR